MANNYYYSPDDSPLGLPRVSPEMIKAYKNIPRRFHEDFQKLQEAYPHLAKELVIQAENYSKDLSDKRAFAFGALFMYTLLSHSAQSTALEQLLEVSFSDGDGDEDQLP